jgi:RNA polymerase sigma-70 factor (ECF subfamily)
MEITGVLEKLNSEGWTDEEVGERVRCGATALYEILMRRYNQRLYRVARAILRDDTEAEDVMQDSYVLGYQHLHQIEGRAPFSAWLTRITVRAALARLQSRKRVQQLDLSEDSGESAMNLADPAPSPEQMASRGELGHLLEEAVLGLPDQYRSVVMLRDVEELSTSETADALALTEQNVKVRLHRGLAMLRGWLLERVGTKAKDAFPFMGVRCYRVVQTVLQRIASINGTGTSS